MCPECLTDLVDDPDATVRCRHCGRDWPATMQSCPDCLSELRLDPTAAAEALGDMLAMGRRVFRPDHLPAFRDGPSCTLLRLSARASLVFLGPDEFVEAEIDGPGGHAVPPLTCHDLDGTLLFRLDHYEPVDGALVAFDADGAPLGTYLKTGKGIEVRDETSAPVAALRRAGAGYELAETGGEVVARCGTDDVEQEGWIDDRWWLEAAPGALPLKPLAAVALLLAAKVLFGRAWPAQVWEQHEDEGEGRIPFS